MPPFTPPTALIAGASRGLGLGLVRGYLALGWRVIATRRDPAAAGGLEAVARAAEGRLEIELLDIDEADQTTALCQRLAGRNLDLLFVNAGISTDPALTAATVSTTEFVRLMVTNALSPMRVIAALEGLVAPTGTIGVMSSALGSIADNDNGGWEIYRASKAALNMLMRSFAARRADDPRSFLILTPGWVRTDMGGPHAELDIETSVAGMIGTIAAQSGKPGLRFLDYRGRTVRW